MNTLRRLLELETELDKEHKVKGLDKNDPRVKEYRALRCIANVLTSRTGLSFISAEALKYIMKRANMDTKGFKKGKFV